MKTNLFITVFFLLGFHVQILPWSTHYLVSERTLKQKSLAFLENQVKVENIESFLNQRHPELKLFFKDFEAWLKKRNPTRYHNLNASLKTSSVESFLRASRLYPRQKFFQVRRLSPHQNAKLANFDSNKLSRYFHSFRNRKKYFVKAEKYIRARDIISTYSDEPDWGIDNDLFAYPEYNYGKAPYGVKNGVGSQGLFHTYYVHENFLVNYFAPELNDSLMPERVALFLGLSKLAKKHGHMYWSYRFFAWALHYLQDITQPYHSRAVPFANTFTYIDYTFSFGIIGRNKKQTAHETALLLSNRHYALEAFTTYCFENSFNRNLHFKLPRVSQFFEKDITFKAKEPLGLLFETSKIAAQNASKLDDKVAETFPAEIAKNGKQNNYYDKNYQLEVFLRLINSDKLTDLWQTTSAFLNLSSASTEHLVNMYFSVHDFK